MAVHEGWRILTAADDQHFTAFLSSREPGTTVMSEKYRAGFLDRRLKKGGRFYVYDDSAAIYHGPGGFFYPTGLAPEAPDGDDLRRYFGTFIRLYSIMGQQQDVQTLTRYFTGTPGISIDYYLLARGHADDLEIPAPPHRDLEIRTPKPSEWRRLLPLQIAYEVEEVLLPGRKANPSASKISLTESLRTQVVLVAYFRGEAVGRVATNARGYRVDQIGGVYTDPAWRGRGLARWLMSHLIHRLDAEQKSASLFVKPQNTAALKLYDRLGFSFESNFRISYYV